MTSKTGNSGFTLIEVLVASVILFAGLGAVLKAYSLAVVAMDAAAETLSICQIAQQVGGELEVQVSRSMDALPSGEGRQIAGGSEYSWQVRTDRKILTPEVSALQVALEVAKAHHPRVHIYHYEWAQFQERKRVQ